MSSLIDSSNTVEYHLFDVKKFHCINRWRTRVHLHWWRKKERDSPEIGSWITNWLHRLNGTKRTTKSTGISLRLHAWTWRRKHNNFPSSSIHTKPEDKCKKKYVLLTSMKSVKHYWQVWMSVSVFSKMTTCLESRRYLILTMACIGYHQKKLIFGYRA